MKERPINFKAWEVQAIRAGRKTQFRRVVKPQPPGDVGIIRTGSFHPATIDKNGEEQPGVLIFGAQDEWGEWGAKHPYGEPGDRLWVRETFLNNALPGYPPVWFYRADGNDKPHDRNWKPSIFCTREASRITLEVVSVRVERLNEISEEDAHEEGVQGRREGGDTDAYWVSAKEVFRDLWQSTNGPGSWEANPFVWVVEFRQV